MATAAVLVPVVGVTDAVLDTEAVLDIVDAAAAVDAGAVLGSDAVLSLVMRLQGFQPDVIALQQ